MSGIPAHGGGRDTTAPDPKVPDSKAPDSKVPDSKAPDATAAHLGAPDHGELVGSAALLDGCERVLARRIRTLRQGDCDWSMRTSELVSSSVLRILDLTDGGRMPITRGRFMGLLDAIVRSVVVDGIRRRSVRRAAQRVLRAQSEASCSGGGPPRASIGESDEARALAQRLIDDMGIEERALVRLRLEGRPWNEVAGALGITSETARQRWTALRKRLRDAAGASEP